MVISLMGWKNYLTDAGMIPDRQNQGYLFFLTDFRPKKMNCEGSIATNMSVKGINDVIQIK